MKDQERPGGGHQTEEKKQEEEEEDRRVKRNSWSSENESETEKETAGKANGNYTSQKYEVRFHDKSLIMTGDGHLKATAENTDSHHDCDVSPDFRQDLIPF
jgi:beta-lactamase superfamily II metal-dependent hydrolase